ncbi:MAG TPA: YiaA/YiaB family inner membrane protein [Bacilli bacterium]|nr:YiaA/YiaB family inner membrane protein [Bacilli bacterium]
MKRKRNTPAFTFLAWTSFAAAVFAMFIGIYTLDATLPVKGYYAVTAMFLIMSSFVLQKTIRDNQEDEAEFGPAPERPLYEPSTSKKKEHMDA